MVVLSHGVTKHRYVLLPCHCSCHFVRVADARRLGVEDAYSTGSDEERDHDEDEPEQYLTSHQAHDSSDTNEYGKDPK